MKAITGQASAGSWPTGDWWDGSGPRETTKHVEFPSGTFASKPAVIAAISTLDASNAANVRISATVTNVSKDHFDLQISTWADTKIAGVTVSWIAVGQGNFTGELGVLPAPAKTCPQCQDRHLCGMTNIAAARAASEALST